MNGKRMPDSSPRVLQLLFSGALAHLAQYLATGCDRSAYLARLVLEQLAETSDDENLNREAGVLIDVLESKAQESSKRTGYPPTDPVQIDAYCAREHQLAA